MTAVHVNTLSGILCNGGIQTGGNMEVRLELVMSGVM